MKEIPVRETLDKPWRAEQKTLARREAENLDRIFE